MGDPDLPNPSVSDPWWTAMRLKAAEMTADFLAPHKPAAIAKACKITVRQLWNWRNHPVFIDEVDRLITQRRKAMRSEAYRAFMANLRANDQSAVRDYLRLTSEMVDRSESGQPGEFDAIAHLTDAELEQRIAERRKALEPDDAA